MRKLSLILLAFVFLFSMILIAEEGKVNFSGTWSYNKDKSETGGEGGRGPGRMASTKLVVKQEKDKIVIERTGQGRDGETFTQKEEITLDGKENKVEGFGGRQRTVTAKWTDEGKTLTFSSVMVMERDGNEFEMKSSEVWSLAEEGKELIMNSTRNTPRGERKSKLVYSKAE